MYELVCCKRDCTIVQKVYTVSVLHTMSCWAVKAYTVVCITSGSSELAMGKSSGAPVPGGWPSLGPVQGPTSVSGPPWHAYKYQGQF